MMSWIATVGGRKLDFLDPNPDEITIHDIARGLSHVARFAGQTTSHYSVAQHSVHCAEHCPDHPLEALLHDATEAYMGDCPRPLKSLMPQWVEIEKRLHAAIFTKFGLDPELPADVKEADNRMLFTERSVLQPVVVDWGWEVDPYYGMAIDPWEPAYARLKFLQEFTRITGEVSLCQLKNY